MSVEDSLSDGDHGPGRQQEGVLEEGVSGPPSLCGIVTWPLEVSVALSHLHRTECLPEEQASQKQGRAPTAPQGPRRGCRVRAVTRSPRAVQRGAGLRGSPRPAARSRLLP